MRILCGITLSSVTGRDTELSINKTILGSGKKCLARQTPRSLPLRLVGQVKFTQAWAALHYLLFLFRLNIS